MSNHDGTTAPENNQAEETHENLETMADDSNSPGSDSPEDAAEELDPENDPAVLRDRWLRSAAELDNMRKRTQREIQNARNRDRESVIRAFLPVLDSLERALDAAGAESNNFVEGIRATLNQMHETLKQFGVEPIDSINQPFDPNLHEAVATANLPDRENQSVAEVIQTGFKLKSGSVLRQSKVVVVSNPTDQND